MKTEDPTNYKHLWDQLRREMADMATRAASEIEQQRAQIARLEPKAHAYDNMSIVLGLLPQTSQGYAEDLAWRLRNQAKILRKPDEPDDELTTEASI